MKTRFSVSGAVLAVLLLVSTFSAAEKPGAPSRGLRLNKSLGDGSEIAVLSINNINQWMTKHALFPCDYSACACASSEYPIGTAGMIYMDGFLYGAKVNDDSTVAGRYPRVRVNGSTHVGGMKAGKVLYNTPGDPSSGVDGPADPDEAQIWIVRKDYKTADIKRDAATFHAIPVEAVTGAQVQESYDGYEYDWLNWPADQGAPFDDVDGDGVYDPAVDIPGYPGADMTMWTVTNDLPRADGTQVATDSYGSPSTGIELQVIIWAYAFAADNPLGNMLFKQFRMIYTGIPGASSWAKLDTVYFVNWSDPDLGDYADDYVGCDTLLSLGYVYNANTVDDIYFGDYSMPVAAGGYDFLQGPITAEGDTLGMTSFTYFGAGSAISDPTQYLHEGSLQYFNMMEGFLPRPAYPAQEPFTDFITGEPTKFVLSGDPVTGEGWVDGLTLPPGDRRLVMSTGPFEMALGDTQDIVVALIGAQGGDNLSSVTVLKYYDLFAQYAYDNNFVLPSPPVKPKVEVFAGDEFIYLHWGQDLDAIAATEEVVKKGFEFEGYNIYQLPSAAATPAEGIKIATFDIPNGITTILEKSVDPGTGQVLDLPAQTGTDLELKHDLKIERDRLRNRPITNDIPYFFGISAYSFLPDAEAVGSPFQSLESDLTLVSVFPQPAAPGENYELDAGGIHDVVHTGTADGFVDVKIISPADFTGDAYEVYFDQQHYYMDVDGNWKYTNYPDSVGKALGKVMDVSGSIISGVAFTSPTAGTRDLKFTLDLVSPDYNYAEGIKLTFPAGIIINSASSEDGIASIIDNVENTVLFGREVKTADDLTGGGVFHGGELFEVNVNTPDLPLDVDYIIYDDGWATLFCADPANAATCEAYGITDAVVVNAEGVCTISEEAFAFKTEKHWNLQNTTTGAILLEDQSVMNGVDIYTGETHPFYGPDAIPITDGYQLNVSAGYAAPLDATKRVPTGTGSYDIDSYYVSGWAEASAMASDALCWGCGTDDIGLLQRDIELRFTGVYDDPVTSITGTDTLIVHPIKEGTGSVATFVGSRIFDTKDHPMNPDPTSDDYFPIRIPFEVWDLDAEGGPAQIDMIIYDRLQNPSAGGDFYAFNPYNRMYCHILHRPYNEEVADVGVEGEGDCGTEGHLLTWNIVFWETDWVIGDVVWFQYDNPIQLGVDTWTFTTAAPTTGGDITADDIERINVFPNPYYGYQVLERSRAAKWMRFNHLPTDREVTIRVFNLGGIMVRTIVKPETDGTQYAEWNLLNQAGYPVASGIYIAFIEIDGVDKTKILKLAIVQEVQILDVY